MKENANWQVRESPATSFTPSRDPELSMFQETSNNFSAVAAQLVEAACSARDGNCEATKAYIAHAVALLHGHPSAMPRTICASPGVAPQIVRGGFALWQARRLTAYIDANLGRTLRIDHLAALLGLSTSHFCRAFRCTFGVSAHDYLTRRRIAVAQGLMLTTRNTLSEIALSCGMSDQSHFTRSFRRIVGETPNSWRRIRRGASEERAIAPGRAPSGRPDIQRFRPPPQPVGLSPQYA